MALLDAFEFLKDEGYDVARLELKQEPKREPKKPSKPWYEDEPTVEIIRELRSRLSEIEEQLTTGDTPKGITQARLRCLAEIAWLAIGTEAAMIPINWTTWLRDERWMRSRLRTMRGHAR